VRTVDESEGGFGHLVIDGLHAFLGEGTRVLNLLSAFAIKPTVEHAPGPETLPVLRVLG